MTFHISQSLLIERTIVISITILLFGLISIGGLWLLRRVIGRPGASAERPPAEATHR